MSLFGQSAPDEQASRSRQKILFVAEAATLAHAGRPAELMRSLDPSLYRTLLAAPKRLHALLGDDIDLTHVDSIEPEVFLERLEKGTPLFDEDYLRWAVREDLALLEREQPDLVVGDFRVSLSISARIANVPYMALVDARWSQYCLGEFPTPDIGLQRWLGDSITDLLFRRVQPLAFKLHTRAIDRVRRLYGLPETKGDLRLAYSDADFVAYCEPPELTAMSPLPPNHRHIGAICWEPAIESPSFLNGLPNRKNVYLCLGSSGPQRMLKELASELASLNVNVITSTAGATLPPIDGVYAQNYLPGKEMCRLADLVICNGGVTAAQALLMGTPVIGLASSMDQLMNMEAMAHGRASRSLRAARVSPSWVRDVASQMLADGRAKQDAQAMAGILGSSDPTHLFPRFIAESLPAPVEKRPAGPRAIHGGDRAQRPLQPVATLGAAQ